MIKFGYLSLNDVMMTFLLINQNYPNIYHFYHVNTDDYFCSNDTFYDRAKTIVSTDIQKKEKTMPLAFSHFLSLRDVFQSSHTEICLALNSILDLQYNDFQ